MKREKETNLQGKRMPLDLPTDYSGLIRVDPLGMYTGIPMDKTEKPQQDADDL